MLARLRITGRLALLVASLLAVLLVVGSAGIVGVRRATHGLETVYLDRVVPLRDLKDVADAYAVSIVDTAHKVRAGTMEAAAGAAAVAKAGAVVRERLSAYLGTRQVERERVLVTELGLLMQRADDAVEELHGILLASDLSALAAFTERRLYPAIDPISAKLTQLVDLQLDAAAQEYATAQSVSRTMLWAVSALLGLGLAGGAALAWLLARSIVVPLRRIRKTMDALASGNLAASVPGTGRSDEIGQMARAVEVFRDGLSHAEQLRAKQAQLRSFVDVAGDGHFTLDADGALTYVSPEFEQRTGLAPDAVAAAVLAHLGAAGRPAPLAALARPLSDVTLALRGVQGDIQSVRASVDAAVDQAGRFTGLYGVVSNVTEAERAKQLAEQRHKLASLGRIAGGIAHDINNVLGAVLAFAGLLKEDLARGSKQHGYADRIDMAATRAKEIVQQILLFTRSSRTETRSVEVRSALQDAIALARAALPSSIEIAASLPPENIFVRGSATHLAQVVLNLCTNARDALPDQVGHVTIAARLRDGAPAAAADAGGPAQATGGPVVDATGFMTLRAGRIDSSRPFVEIRVADDGTGMEPDVLARVLDPFFTTKAVGKGTGLGIPVVLGIATEWGGALEIKTKPGAGTAVAILLPQSQPESDAAADRAVAEGDEPAAMILIADDNLDLGDAMAEALRKAGHEVTCVPNGIDALAVLREAADVWDLLLTDQVMPGMKGIELIREAKRLRPDLPCILMTGFSDSADPQRVAAAGADLLLNKPFPIDELRRHVSRLLAARPVGV